MNRVRPQIAIVSPNTLTALGLSSMLKSMMPMMEVKTFDEVDRLINDPTPFVHYFVTTSSLMHNIKFFMKHMHQTIVLIEGDEMKNLPASFITLNICLPEKQMIKAFFNLQNFGHQKHPQALQQIEDLNKDNPLTPREIDVLRLIVAGRINKEIAELLNVGLATVITHRKHLMEKLRIKSVSGLTVYAVMHNLIKLEDI